MRKHTVVTIVAVVIAVVVIVSGLYFVSIQSVQAPMNLDVVTDGEDRIRVSYPLEGTVITSPLVVKGEARGIWYFEASFPIVVVNWDGLIIGEGHAEAQSDWMTGEYVPFEGTITFTKPECPIDTDYCKRGAVILRKDNPSGLPEHDAAVEISIVFE